MSVFAVGGKLGFTFGPLVATAAISTWGMAGTAIFIVPSSICALVLLGFNRTFLAFGAAEAQAMKSAEPRDDWKGFSFVMGAIGCRSIIYYALLSFIPLFLVANLGQSESFASTAISLFAVVCAVGTLVSGWAGRILGAKRLIIVSYVLVALEIVLFALNDSLIAALALIAVLAVTEDISYPSAVALGQSFVPHHLGMASGISFGVMVCIGGIASPALGLVGDGLGLQAVMFCVAAIALVGVAIAAFIPTRRS